MPETTPAVPHTDSEIAHFIREPQFAGRLDMLTLAMRTGNVSLELASAILGLPRHAVGRILAEMVVERVPDAVVQIEAATATFLLLARSPAEVGELTAALLA